MDLPLEYNQNDSNSCCFGSLAYAFYEPVEKNSSRAIAIRIKEYLQYQSKGYKDIIVFDTATMKYYVRKTGEKSLCYKIKKWKNR